MEPEREETVPLPPAGSSTLFRPPRPGIGRAVRGLVFGLALPAVLLTGMRGAEAVGGRWQAVRLAALARELPPSPPPASLRGVQAPWRVGLQVGHWKIEELPDELARLHGSTGTRWREVTELAVNLEIARRTARLLEAAGVRVDLLAATVPPGYEADAFVAIHADGAARRGARGWKIAAPWRSSPAARRLRQAVAARYGQLSGLPEDRYGLTYQMRGYYAFSSHRIRHAAAATTPAIIVEAGYLSSAEDRLLLLGRPETAARGIAEGVIAYLAGHNPFDTVSLVPLSFPMRRVAGRAVDLRALPEADAPAIGLLPVGTEVQPVHREGGWVEVRVRGNYRRFGWVPETSLE
jgi:N-acetylmuramoyl-L-alanine amidase